MSTPANPDRLRAIGKALIRGVVGVVLLVIAFSVFAWLRATAPETPRVERDGSGRSVAVMTTRLVTAPRVWRGFGTARSKSAADVAAEVTAPVLERPDRIDPGVEVRAGEVILRLDDSEFSDRLSTSLKTIAAYEAELDGLVVELESAQESLEFAEEAVELLKSELARLERAVEQGSANMFELEPVRSNLTRAMREAEAFRRTVSLIPSREARLRALIDAEEARASAARRDISRCLIAAPFDGRLQSVGFDDGELVRTGEIAARVVDLSLIEAPIRLPVSSVRSVGVGDPVTLRDARLDPDSARTGRVARIAPEADGATRTITVFVELEQDPSGSSGAVLLPGEFVIADVVTSYRTERIVVPRSAVRDDRVFVADEQGLARSRPVEVAYSIDAEFPDLSANETQWTVVASGLGPGERVVLTGVDALRDGTPVRPAGVPLARNGGAAGAASGAGATP